MTTKQNIKTLLVKYNKQVNLLKKQLKEIEIKIIQHYKNHTATITETELQAIDSEREKAKELLTQINDLDGEIAYLSAEHFFSTIDSTTL